MIYESADGETPKEPCPPRPGLSSYKWISQVDYAMRSWQDHIPNRLTLRSSCQVISQIWGYPCVALTIESAHRWGCWYNGTKEWGMGELLRKCFEFLKVIIRRRRIYQQVQGVWILVLFTGESEMSHSRILVFGRASPWQCGGLLPVPIGSKTSIWLLTLNPLVKAVAATPNLASKGNWVLPADPGACISPGCCTLLCLCLPLPKATQSP